MIEIVCAEPPSTTTIKSSLLLEKSNAVNDPPVSPTDASSLSPAKESSPVPASKDAPGSPRGRGPAARPWI